jgi:hypothetical protein
MQEDAVASMKGVILNRVTPIGDFAIYFKEQTGLDFFHVEGDPVRLRPVMTSSGATMVYQFKIADIKERDVFDWVTKRIVEDLQDDEPRSLIVFYGMMFHIDKSQVNVDVLPKSPHRGIRIDRLYSSPDEGNTYE